MSEFTSALRDGSNVDLVAWAANVPSASLTASKAVANQAARLALSKVNAAGFAVIDTDSGKTWMLKPDADCVGASGAWNAADWLQLGDRDIQWSDVSKSGAVPGDIGAAPIASPAFTGTVGGITKSMVGLSSVDNTADAAKSVASAAAVPWTGVTGKPSTFAPVIGSGAADAVAGNDSRLSDARIPTSIGLASTTHAATSKSVLIDGDEIAITDSANSYAPKKALWSSIKSTLKSYFDGLYPPIARTIGGVDLTANRTLSDIGAASRRVYKTTGFTAAAYGRYHTAGTITITDPTSPTPVAGDIFDVVIVSGTANIGGVTYQASRFPIEREYDGTSWTTLAPILSDNLTLPGMVINGTTAAATGVNLLGASTATGALTTLGGGTAPTGTGAVVLVTSPVIMSPSTVGVSQTQSFGAAGVGGFKFDPANNLYQFSRVLDGNILCKINMGANSLECGTLVATSNNVILGGYDTYLSRKGAGILGVGTSSGSITGEIQVGKITASGDIAFGKTITASGTTGAQTINKTTGSVNLAAAATSLVVTNSLVTTSSVIQCTVGTNDTTAKSVQVVAAAGSFTIYPNAAPTAETKVFFTVTN